MMTLERSVRHALRVYRRINVELLYSDSMTAIFRFVAFSRSFTLVNQAIYSQNEASITAHNITLLTTCILLTRPALFL